MVRIIQPALTDFGVLTATEVRTPLINSPSANLDIQKGGVSHFLLDGAKVYVSKHITLNPNIEIWDSSSGVLIAGDNSGHIDQLGRVDAHPTTPANAFFAAAYLGEIAANGIGGSIAGTPGYWQTDANETYQCDLGQILPIQFLNGEIRIDYVKIEFTSENNDDYIDLVAMYEWDLSDDAPEMGPPLSDSTDKGNGSSGRSEAVYTPAGTVNINTDHTLTLYVECVNGSGYVRLHNILIKYSLV